MERKYNYEIVLKNDSDNYSNVLSNLLLNYEIAYCVHDKDVNEETGEDKYIHTHVVVRLKNAMTITALSKKVGCKENEIQHIKSLGGALKYLCHYGQENKYNYPINKVLFNSDELKSKFLKLIRNDDNEETSVLELIEYIDNHKGYIVFSHFLKHICDIRAWSVYRRNCVTFMRLIDNHNELYLKFNY